MEGGGAVKQSLERAHRALERLWVRYTERNQDERMRGHGEWSQPVV